MKHFLSRALPFVLASALSSSALAQKQPVPPKAEQVIAVDETPTVDIVFCIDQSGSMDQIIATAKTRVWSIVNEFGKAKIKPKLRIGLIGYGDDSFGANTGYIKVYTNLTVDLDTVYEELMKLKTNGSTELVGQVLSTATNEMKWSTAKNSLKMIFIIGNERADQDTDKERFDYKKVAKSAIQKGIMVSAIYGGTTDLASAEPQWQEISAMTDGTYARIDITGGAVAIATPYDDQILKKNEALNKTYLPFGTKGKQKYNDMETQDSNAKGAGSAAAPKEAMVARAEAKSGDFYQTSTWDLVEAIKDPSFKLEDAKDADLPSELRGKTTKEKKEMIEKAAKERESIKKEISTLSKEREQYVQEELKKQNLDDSKGLDAVMKKSIREKAAKANITF
jgi:Mg-chelatase subunit ChlD